VVVYAVEAADTSYRGATDLEAATGFQVMGMTLVHRRGWAGRLLRSERLPSLLRRRAGFFPPATSFASAPGSAEAESVGLVRTAITKARSGHATKTLLVTSALPGEGKSAFALALCASAVRTGQRSLIIEADLRKPSLAAELRISPTVGLGEFLRGDATIEEIIRTDAETGVDIIPCARPAQDAVALLRSERMSQLILDSSEIYDFIVIDTPPVMLVEDALQIDSSVLDAVVIAVKWGGSPRNIVEQAFRRVVEMGLPLIGSVMTQVDPKRYASYGNGRLPIDYAGRYYLMR
jgi:capsular exopolysaccharide synthesis family protein